MFSAKLTANKTEYSSFFCNFSGQFILWANSFCPGSATITWMLTNAGWLNLYFFLLAVFLCASHENQNICLVPIYKTLCHCLSCLQGLMQLYSLQYVSFWLMSKGKTGWVFCPPKTWVYGLTFCFLNTPHDMQPQDPDLVLQTAPDHFHEKSKKFFLYLEPAVRFHRNLCLVYVQLNSTSFSKCAPRYKATKSYSLCDFTHIPFFAVPSMFSCYISIHVQHLARVSNQIFVQLIFSIKCLSDWGLTMLSCI